MADFYLNDKQYKAMMEATFGKGNNRKKDDDDDLLLTAATKTEKPKQQGFLGDFVDSVQMGMWRGVSDLSRAVGVASDSKWFNETADWAAKKADENLKTMSPEMQKALQQSAFDGIDEDGEGMGVLNARWWAGSIGSMLGANADIALTLGGSALLTTGAKVAGKAALKTISKESAEKIGQAAIEQATKRGLPAKYKYMVGATAAMSAMQAGSRANSAIKEYLARADEEVVNDEVFRQAYHDLKNSDAGQGLDHDSLFDLAKEKVAHQVGRSAALNPTAIFTDIATNAVAGLGGGVLGLGSAAKTLKGGLLKGAVIEGATEAAQGAVEQYAVNQAAQQHYDPNRDVMQGVADNAINSAVIGGGFGAPMGVVDTLNHRMAVGKQKKELLKMVHTGNEAIDAQLRNYVDMVNQNATDLADLVSINRINALNAIGQKEARAKELMQSTESAVGFGGDFAIDEPVQTAQSSNLQYSANIAPTSRHGVIVGVNDEIDIGNGNYQPFQYEVMDASTLNPTQHKDDNQFRDRDRVASQSQINHIARHLDPRKLASAPTMEMGAPLLALDGQTIIAGNGRTMAIKQAYQEGGAEAYRQYLQENAERFGLEPEQVNAVTNPVLVRRLTSPVDIAQVAINSNEQGGMRMSELEQAKVDARRLPHMDTFIANDNGQINSPDNRQFIRQFIQNQPENLRNELLDSKGELSQTGVQRIRNAMLYQAYGDSQVLSRLIENTDQGAKNVLNALISLAPKVSQAQQSINDGTLSDVGISQDIIQAVEKYNQLNAQGYKISDYLAQNDFIGDLSAEAREILAVFDENRRSGKRIAQVLGAYFDQAQIQGNLSQASIFGEFAFDKLGTLQQARTVQEADDSETNRYSFAGENAKTADHSLLTEAKSAVENGKNPEIVRQQTGWFKGVDDKWRFEIDDSQISFKRDWDKSVNAMGVISATEYQKGYGAVATLGDILNAPELFAAYPDITRIPVSVNYDPNYGGGYNPAEDKITISSGYNLAQTKSVLLHEIQHAIQERENFARGAATTSPNYDEHAGEVEARNVQIRLKMDKQARLNHSPESTEDTPRGIQIISYDYGIANSLNEAPNSGFVRAVDKAANGYQGSHKRFVKMGKTPDVLKMVGLPDATVSMREDVFNKVLGGKHSLTAEDLKRLPQQLNDPIAITRSRTVENGYLVFTELNENVNGVNKPIAAALHVKAKNDGIEIIDVASAYGRNVSQINEDLKQVLYWNKQKGYPFVDRAGLQLPNVILNLDNLSASNIKTETDLSQYQSAKNQPSSIDTQKFKQILTKAVGESAVKNIDVIQSGTKPEGVQQLITADVEGWFNPRTGRITLVADGIRATPTMTREERIAWVGWHELAHRGVNVRLKGEYKSIMHRADSHPLINAVATEIQQERKGKNDGAADDRHLAVEEALAEVFAAYQTGNFNELAARYGVKMSDKGFKVWLRKFADKVRALIDKLFGRDVAENFSDTDLVNLMSEIKQGIHGESAVKNQGVFFSTQSKSATDNNGAFDRNNEDIRFSQTANSIIQNATVLPKRQATTFAEARERAKEFQGKVLTNKPSQVTAVVSRNSLDKMLSAKAVGKSESPETHSLAVANLDSLYENAVYGWSKPDRDEDTNIVAIHRLFSILETDNGQRLVKLTVKEISLKDQSNKLYTVEAVELDEKTPAAQWVDAAANLDKVDLISIRSAGDIYNLAQQVEKSNSFNENSDEIRFSRTQSALDLARTGKAKSDNSLWEDLKARDFEAVKKRFNELVGKIDETFADSLRPVNDWIDQMQFSEHTGQFNGRNHEKRRLKDAMYAAKGKRDALNSELEQRFLKPLLKELAAIAKKTKGKDEKDVKALVGTWLSTRYSIEKNAELLQIDEQAMLEAGQKRDDLKAQGASVKEIHQAELAYRKAEKQYWGRKADVESRDFSNDRKYQVGVAGGWSVPLAREIMKEIEAKIPKAALEKVGDLVADLNQARLEIDRDSGRYTEAEYQRYKQNRHYVPLTGDPNAEADFDFIAGVGGNAVNIGRDKALKGRTGSEADDAITAVWEATGKSTTYAGWSDFKNKIDDLFETEVALLKGQGYSEQEARIEAEKNIGIGKRRMQGLTRSSDNVLIAKRGGIYYEYALPNRVMNALKADNVEQANEFLKVLSKPTSLYARGVTQWTVTFAPINMLRDTWEKSEFIRVQKLYDEDGKLLDSKTMDNIGRALLGNALFNPSKMRDTWAATKRFGFGQALRDDVPSERMLKELIKQGGLSNYGTYLARSEQDLIKRLKRENNPLWRTLEKAGAVLEGYNNTFDTVSALSAYKALIENNVDPQQAAAVTLELTNFRKTGAKMRGIKSLYMFSQPTVMGAANLLRYLSTRKGQLRFAAYFAGMTALYSVLRAFDEEDEGGNKMDQLGDITRYIPLPLGGGDYLKIPVGFGMPQMAWNFAVNTVKGTVADISYSEAAVNMLSHSVKTFAPVSPSEISALKYPLEKAALTVTPSILQPLMQNAVNRSAFGNQITPSFVRTDKLKAEQSKSTTAQFWKEAAIVLNDELGIDMHPEQVKNLVDGYSGMLGSLREINTILIENPNREILGRNTRMPFVNQLYGAGNEFSIQSRYYQASEEAETLHKQYSSLKARGGLDAQWLTEERKQILRFHEENKSLTSSLRSEKAQLTKQLRNGKISADTYEKRLKAYNEKMTRLQGKILHKWRMMEGLNTSLTDR